MAAKNTVKIKPEIKIPAKLDFMRKLDTFDVDATFYEIERTYQPDNGNYTFEVLRTLSTTLEIPQSMFTDDDMLYIWLCTSVPEEFRTVPQHDLRVHLSSNGFPLKRLSLIRIPEDDKEGVKQ